MDEKDKRPMRTNPRLAEHALAHRFKFVLGRVNIGHFVTEMVLPPLRVLFKESGGSISSICVPLVPFSPGVSTKQTFTPCEGRSNGS
jgi:hypothetical protein